MPSITKTIREIAVGDIVVFGLRSQPYPLGHAGIVVSVAHNFVRIIHAVCDVHIQESEFSINFLLEVEKVRFYSPNLDNTAWSRNQNTPLSTNQTRLMDMVLQIRSQGGGTGPEYYRPRIAQVIFGNPRFGVMAKTNLRKYHQRATQPTRRSSAPEQTTSPQQRRIVDHITCTEFVILCYQLAFYDQRHNRHAPLFIKRDAKRTAPTGLGSYLERKGWTKYKITQATAPLTLDQSAILSASSNFSPRPINPYSTLSPSDTTPASNLSPSDANPSSRPSLHIGVSPSVLSVDNISLISASPQLGHSQSSLLSPGFNPSHAARSPIVFDSPPLTTPHINEFLTCSRLLSHVSPVVPALLVAFAELGYDQPIRDLGDPAATQLWMSGVIGGESYLNLRTALQSLNTSTFEAQNTINTSLLETLQLALHRAVTNSESPNFALPSRIASTADAMGINVVSILSFRHFQTSETFSHEMITLEMDISQLQRVYETGSKQRCFGTFISIPEPYHNLMRLAHTPTDTQRSLVLFGTDRWYVRRPKTHDGQYSIWMDASTGENIAVNPMTGWPVNIQPQRESSIIQITLELSLG